MVPNIFANYYYYYLKVKQLVLKKLKIIFIGWNSHENHILFCDNKDACYVR